MAEDTSKNETPQVPGTKPEILAAVKSYVFGLDLSDPAKRAILNEISDMVSASQAPIYQVLASAIAMTDNLVAAARAVEQGKASQNEQVKKSGDLANAFWNLTAEELAKVAQLDKDLAALAQKNQAFDKEIEAKSNALNDKFAKDNPGFGKPFTEATAQEIQQWFDGMTPEERKRKAQEYLPDVEDLLGSHKKKLDNLDDMTVNLAQRNKIVHRLKEDDLERQVDEMQDRVERGQGNPQMEKDIGVAKELLEIRDETRDQVHNLQQKKDLFEGMAKEQHVAVEKNTEAREEKEEELQANEADLLELCHDIFGTQGIKADTLPEYRKQVSQAFKDGRLPEGETDEKATFDEVGSFLKIKVEKEAQKLGFPLAASVCALMPLS